MNKHTKKQANTQQTNKKQQERKKSIKQKVGQIETNLKW